MMSKLHINVLILSEIIRRERELEATVRKPAEAEKYKVEKIAEANKNKIILEAEAEAEAVRVCVLTSFLFVFHSFPCFVLLLLFDVL